MAQFVVPDQYGGKSLNQIAKEGGAVGRTDVLGQLAGIDPNTPLTAGQTLNLPDTSGFPTSTEGKFVMSNFTPLATSLQNTIKISNQNAIDTLKSGLQPLNESYANLINSIQGTGAQEVKNADITSARELARRGISTNSDFAAEYQQSKRVPVETAFQGQEAAVRLSQEQARQNVNNAIANIQSASGVQEVQAALQQFQQAEQSRQYNETLALQKAKLEQQQNQFNQTLDYNQNQVQTSFQTVGGRIKLVNSQTGEVIADLGTTSTSGSGLTLDDYIKGLNIGSGNISDLWNLNG